MPESLKPTVQPILDTLTALSEKIDGNDQRVEELSRGSFHETRILRQVHGVGPLIVAGEVCEPLRNSIQAAAPISAQVARWKQVQVQ